MKSKFKYFISIVCILFLNINLSYSDELNFEASEIQVLNSGNKLKAIDGVKILTNDGTKINAEEFEYDKTTLILIAKGNVKIIDEINQLLVNAPEIIYYKDKDTIITKGKTTGLIENYYNFKTRDLVFNRKRMEIISDYKTDINDKDNNIFKLNNFNYLIGKKIFKAEKIKFISNTKDEFYFENAMVDLISNEIIGKDVVINFNKSAFANKENDPRLKGNVVYANKNITKVSKGVFTTCKKRDGCPPWVISAEEVVHDKTKKTINYKNAWLEVYDTPVMYFPKFFHPDPTVKRQSGFLIPTFIDSQNLGSSFDIPYFQVVSDSKDFTLKPRFYSDQKYILQSEYRTVTKNSEHTFDISFMKGHEVPVGDQGDSRSHFFSNSVINLDIGAFDQSKLEVNIEQTSNDRYLKLYDLKSPIIKNYSTLNSYLNFEASKEDLQIKTSLEVFEDLNKKQNDRYEYIYPNVNILKLFDTSDKYNGNFSLEASGHQKKFNTNTEETILINNLLYKSDPFFNTRGFKNNYSVLLKNVNTNAKSSPRYKNEKENEILGIVMFETSYPMQKKDNEYDNFLTPKISLRYSPTETRNIVDDDRRIDINNVFSLDRIGTNDTLEGGQSLTIGTEFRKVDKDNNDFLSINLAKVFRDKVNEDLPTRSTIGNKESDIIGNFKVVPNSNFSLDYDFSIDNNLETTNFHMIKTEFKTNNFITSFEYLEENNAIGNENYFVNKTSFILDQNNSIGFSTRKNKKTNLTEFYNLIYEYKNDCLTAAIEYNKEYYDDNVLKPEEQIYFSLTIMPFSKMNSPSLYK